MNRTPEQWAKVKPQAVRDGSEAQCINVMTMMLEDIAAMAHRLDRARELISCLIENDPNDYAADAVTVLDVWRKDAEAWMKRTD